MQRLDRKDFAAQGNSKEAIIDPEEGAAERKLVRTCTVIGMGNFLLSAFPNPNVLVNFLLLVSEVCIHVPIALRQDVVRKAIMVGSPWWSKDPPLTADIKQKYGDEEARILIAPAKTCPLNDRTPFHKVFPPKGPRTHSLEPMQTQCREAVNTHSDLWQSLFSVKAGIM